MNAPKSIILAFALLVLPVGHVVAQEEPTSFYDMKSPAIPVENIFTGGQPSEADLIKMKEQGVTTVISLRTREEEGDFDEQSYVESLGMNFQRLPISGRDEVTLEIADEFDELVLAEEGNKIFIHCASSNRVGAMFALRAFNYGAEPMDAIALGESAGLTSLKPIVEAQMKRKRD